MQTSMRRDKRKTPRMFEYQYLTQDECRALVKGGHVQALDKFGKLVTLRVTAIHTWKRRDDVEVHWKYGLYEYGVTVITADKPNQFFVKILEVG